MKVRAPGPCPAWAAAAGVRPSLPHVSWIAALRAKKIRGAYLDVFEAEPLPQESALWGLDNLLMSPHCVDVTPTMYGLARPAAGLHPAGVPPASAGALRRMQGAITQFVDNVKLFCRGEQLQNVADKHAGY